jgi:hypothetical protein
MQFRNAHHPYFGSFEAPVHYRNGMEYPYLPSYNTIETDHYFQNQTQMSMDSRQKSGHTHGHSGATTCQDGHVHMHPGVTSTPIETAEGHVHKIWGNTTFDDGHIHYYEAYTSPPISLPNGFHTHYVEIKTTEDDGHIHIIKGFTQPSKS